MIVENFIFLFEGIKTAHPLFEYYLFELLSEKLKVELTLFTHGFPKYDMEVDKIKRRE